MACATNDQSTRFANIEQDLFDNALVGVLITKDDGTIVKVNSKFAQWIGVSASSILGTRFSDHLSISGKIYVETHLAPLLHMQGAYDEVALELAPNNGARVPVLVNAQERKDAAGKITSVLMFIVKSTQRHQYESDLLSARNELRSLNENLAQTVQREVDARLSAEGRYNYERETAQLREQFIAVLGHDLRNPLAGIDIGLRILSRIVGDERSISTIAFMQKSVVRMSELISDLMDFARGRMGEGMTLQKKPTDLELVLKHVCDEITVAHPEKTIDLHVDLVRTINCDPFRIAQLFSNLIGNAITHGEAHGVVQINCTEQSAGFQISVANKGPTIPPEVLGQLFGPFVRSTAGQYRKGLGLGLYISSQIARAHGGKIGVSSREHKTVFTFTMPTTFP